MVAIPDAIDCRITGLTAAGEGVARHEGKVIFVPGALVGESVRIAIVRRGARFDRARLVEVLEAAGRQPTPCPHDHASGCGGCSLLHATRAAQAAAKRTIVADALARLAGQDPALVGETLTPGPDLGYRNHARFGVDPKGRLTYVARPEGLTERGTIAIDGCAVLDRRLDQLRAELDGRVGGATEVELRIGARTGERLAVLHGTKRCPPGLDPTRIDASIVLAGDAGLVPVRGASWIHEVVLGHRFRISPASFFQVNTDGAEALAGVVRRFAGDQPIGRALDLYAGVGLFTVVALASAREVSAVEIDAASSADFRANTAAFPGVRLRTEPAVDVLRDLRPGRDVFDLAIANPPRAGLGEGVVAALAALRVPRTILVSCDPGSLARDVATLARACLRLREAVPVDQFPGTPHVETVAVLEG